MVDSVGKNMALPVGRQNGVAETRLHKAVIDPHGAHTARVGTVAAPAAPGSDFSAPPVDLGHVEQIKAQIESGNYRVDPDQLARDMLDWGKAPSE